MKPLRNISLFENRIKAIAKRGAPKFPVKGRGYQRVLCNFDPLFARLAEIAPLHCAEVLSREAVNSFGKLGFRRYGYVSLELGEALKANELDLATLSAAANRLMAARMTWMVKSQ